jgi:peptidoglycan-associated lipoprotein
MIRLHCVRVLLISSTALALAVAGCHKKPVAATAPQPLAPAVKPTASLTADRASINGGESVKLSWNTTDASKVSITPEVGAVAPQGSTAVMPSASTTYTLTASGTGGSAESSVRVSVIVPTPSAEMHKPSLDELFLKDIHDAYFDYDSASLRPDAREALQKSAEFLRNYPSARVTVEGHCDERGSTEYNLALGQSRSNAVRQYLVSLGVPADQIGATSLGKEKPFCNDANEACWQQNRRGHFTLNK